MHAVLCASLGCLSESARLAAPRGSSRWFRLRPSSRYQLDAEACATGFLMVVVGMALKIVVASCISTPLAAEDRATGLLMVVVGMALTIVVAFFWRNLKLHAIMATQITKEGKPTATPTTTPEDTPEPPPKIKLASIDKEPSALTMTPGM